MGVAPLRKFKPHSAKAIEGNNPKSRMVFWIHDFNLYLPFFKIIFLDKNLWRYYQ